MRVSAPPVRPAPLAAVPAEVPARASPELAAAEAAADASLVDELAVELLDEHAAVTVASAAIIATATMLVGFRRVRGRRKADTMVPLRVLGLTGLGSGRWQGLAHSRDRCMLGGDIG